jgi:hypothetical protein
VGIHGDWSGSVAKGGELGEVVAQLSFDANGQSFTDSTVSAENGIGLEWSRRAVMLLGGRHADRDATGHARVFGLTGNCIHLCHCDFACGMLWRLSGGSASIRI